MNSEFDFIVRNGSLVLPGGVYKLDMGIREGRITAIEPVLEGGGCRIIDAASMTVMPGGVDVHVHLNEPGMGHWEGFRTGSAALAAGGTTTYLDMPLNGRPPTVTAKTFYHKIELADGNSAVDYALWGGLMPGYIDRLEELSEAGAIGFKAFMSSPGMTEEDDFREVDDQTLLLGMEAIAGLGAFSLCMQRMKSWSLSWLQKLEPLARLTPMIIRHRVQSKRRSKRLAVPYRMQSKQAAGFILSI